jgi:hypothetical protein
MPGPPGVSQKPVLRHTTSFADSVTFTKTDLEAAKKPGE